MEQTKRIQQIEEVLLQRHPQWSQDKARWMAMQALGIIKR
jgi:hypothetical protein